MPRSAPLAAALAIATLAVFAPVRHHEFVHYDDNRYIFENPNLREGLSPASVVRAFTTPYETNWIPLTWVSLQVDHALYGLEPAGYLLTNAALHALSAALLFLALRRMTGATWRSAFAAAVFAVHPLHVESVAWASERKDALSGVFWMLGLLAYARYAERPGSVGRYAGVALALALGLLAKPMLVTFPLVLLLLDFWPLGRVGRERPARLLLEKLPLLALAAAAALVTYAVQRELGAMPAHPPPFGVRIENAVHATTVYLLKSFWPTDLAVFYPYPPRIAPPGVLAAETLLLVVLTGSALALAATRGYLAVGWLWYLLTLLPVLGLVQVGMQARADRYTYLPQIGLGVALAWGAVDLVGAHRVARRGLAVAAVAALLALSAGTRAQLRHWRDTQSLFSRAAAVTQGNFLAHKVLADEHLRAGRLREAEAGYRASIALKGDWDGAHLELGKLLRDAGRVDAGIAHLRLAARLRPADADVVGELGSALLAAGRFEQARDALEVALRRSPESALLHAQLAAAQTALGDLGAAVRHGREAVRRDPALGWAANNLAWILATSADPSVRDPERAVRLAEGAIGTASGDALAGFLGTLAAAQAAAGRFEDAAATAERAARQAASSGDAELAARLREHRSRYRAGRALAGP